MEHLFPPLLPRELLEPPVVAFAAHPDDEVIGCGAMLAWHRLQGHPVKVVHVTDGASGDPEGRFGDARARRRAEGVEALRRLGVEDVVGWDFPDGGVFEHLDAVAARVRELLEDVCPRTVYSFFFTEAHRDHRAVARAVAAAGAAVLAPQARMMLYGVNQVVPGGAMFDCSELMDVKQHALAAYESQLYYNDFALKILHRDHAATVNVEDRAVQYAELFAVLRPHELEDVRVAAERLYERVARAQA